MTVIHTTDDLIRLLDENDEFRQAVRRHVLSDELLQLPERLAKFEAHVEGFIDEQREFNQEQRERNQRMEGAIDELRALNRRMDTAIGELRGKVARQVVGVHFLEIADGMGFRFKGLLTRLDLGQLIVQRTFDIPQNDRSSFFRADLVVEVTDSADAVHYIAVEASYTADERDTSRAQRNATLLTQLTGHPAHAAIASVRNVHEIQALIDDGTVYWYALNPADFTPD